MRKMMIKKMFGLILLVIILACTQKHQNNQQAKNPLPIDSVHVQLKIFTHYVTGIGQLQAIEQTELIAQFAGQFRLANQGKQCFQKGEIIFRLTGSSIDYQKRLYQQEARSARTEKEFYQNKMKRKQELFKNHFVSPEQWNELEKNYQLSLLRKEKADSSLAFFRAMTNFRAPFAGTLSEIQVPQNSYLKTGATIGQFLNPNKIKLVLPWYDKNYLPEPGTTFKLVLDDSVRRTGNVIFVDHTVDAQSGGQEIWLQLSRLPENYLPGQWVACSIELANEQKIAIPQSALLAENHRYWVIITDSGKCRVHQVSVGNKGDGWVEIQSGLKPGEWVISQGAYELYYENAEIKYKIKKD